VVGLVLHSIILFMIPFIEKLTRYVFLVGSGLFLSTQFGVLAGHINNNEHHFGLLFLFFAPVV
jgi:hypothetical protein